MKRVLSLFLKTSMVVALLAGVLLGAGLSPASAVESGTSSPAATPPGMITEYEGNQPAYAGAPWFKPGDRYSANFPDPAVVWDGSRYWAYSTSTGGPTLPAMWSTDLTNWTARDQYAPNTYNSDPFFNDAFPVPPSWSLGGAVSLPGKAQWAPGVTKIGGAWTAYTSWEVSPGRRCISAARASSPAGPFVDRSSQPLVCDPGALGSIDAAAFLDAAGQPWLTWKAEPSGGMPGAIYSRALSADGLSFKPGSAPNLLLVSVKPWEAGVVENPSMLYSGGSYWLVYSGHLWDSSSYRMGQARRAGPAGPCDRTSDVPLFGNDSTDLGPGGGALFVDASGRTRLAYHAWNAPFSAYPDDPNCDGPSLCTSQGQRFLHVDGVAEWAGRLTVDPIGMLDVVSSTADRINVAGWALDPSTSAPIAVHVYVDGTPVGITADGGRPDVGAAFPGLGSAHGFSASIPAGSGSHQVCAYGIDVGAGGNNLIACRSVVVAGGPPFGSLDAVAGVSGGIAAAGWAIDPDTAGPIQVHVYVDGVGVATTADSPRPDVGNAYPGYGDGHGYWATVPAGPGPHTACAYGINVATGSNSLLGCRSAVVPDASPFGSLDAVVGGAGTVAVAGWAIDPDTNLPIDVHVYVDGRGVALRADAARPDVGLSYPTAGPAHGYVATLAATPGPHTVCTYGINVGGGGNSVLGCRVITVR